MTSSNQIIVSSAGTGIGILLLLIIQTPAVAQNPNSCNCIVFRFDGVQDYWMMQGQIPALDVFEKKNASITLGIIVNSFGEDFEIVNKTQKGVESGVFEPAILGWNHVSYANLSAGEQSSTISNASTVLTDYLGEKPIVFIPPYSQFNNATLATLKQNNITIMSAAVTGDPYIAKKGAAKQDFNASGIFNLPPVVEFNEHDGDTSTKVPVEKIVFELNKAITKYGYGVVIIRPTDFVESVANPTTDKAEITDLVRLIDILQSQNRNIVSMEHVVNYR